MAGDARDTKSDTGRLFSIREAVTSPESPLCARASAAWLYAKAKTGAVPGLVRVGRKVYVTEAGLREFIANGGAR